MLRSTGRAAGADRGRAVPDRSRGAPNGRRCWPPDEARLADRNISALAPDGNGHLWIGYFDRGLDILDSRAGRARHIEDDVVFCVNRIVHDRERERTAVATSNGLVMFSTGGDPRQVLTRADGLIASQVTDVLFRPDGSMVAGTPAGVSFIEAARISSIYAFHGLVNNHVYALGQMGPRTLVGTLGGFSVDRIGLGHRQLHHLELRASNTTGSRPCCPSPTTSFVGTYGGGVMHLSAVAPGTRSPICRPVSK